MPHLTPEILSQRLQFRPVPIWDPAPDLSFLVDRLDKAQLVRLAVVGLELHKSVLEVQLKANAQVMEIIKGVK